MLEGKPQATMRLLDADWRSGWSAGLWGQVEREKDEFREPGRTGLGRALNAR